MNFLIITITGNYSLDIMSELKTLLKTIGKFQVIYLQKKNKNKY